MTKQPERDLTVHYEQQLDRSMGVFGNFMAVVGTMVPAPVVFFYIPVALQLAGTWAFPAGLLIMIMNVPLWMCYSELGSAYPVASGEYGLIGRVLGRPLGLAVYLLMVFFFILMLASLAVGAGLQMQSVWASANVTLVALIVVGIGAAFAVLNINVSWRLMSALFVVQMVAVALISVLGIVHAQDSVHRLFSPVAYGPDGSVAPITATIIVTGLMFAVFNTGGFGNAVIFSEETKDARRKVMWAIGLVMIFNFITYVVPLGAAIVGTPSMKTLLTDPAPMSYLLTEWVGDRFNTFVNLALLIAYIQGQVACAMAFGRVLWSGARDDAFPGPVSRALQSVSHKTKAPWVAILVISGLSAIGCAWSSMANLVIYQSAAMIVYTLLVAVAAFGIRFLKDAPDRFKAPLWPLSPVIVMVVLVGISTQLSTKEILVPLGILAAGLVYYYVYLWPRRDRQWVLIGAPEEELDLVAEGSPAGASLETIS